MMDDELRTLARYARACIARELGGPAAMRPRGDEVNALGASFVTLRWRGGTLQGCIGSLEPRRVLAEDIAENALAASFDDPRAAPITLADLDDLHVEVSILSAVATVVFDGSERGACEALRVGLDGVVLRWRGQRGTFLPQMWEQLPTPTEFLSELKRKARLPSDFWSHDIELQRYTVKKGIDPSPRAALDALHP